MKIFFRTFVIPLFLFLSGCAGKYEEKLNFNPLEPIRVAVLPFAYTNGKGEIVDADAGLLIDQVGLVSSELKNSPNRYIQNLVQSQLAKSGLDVVSPAYVEAQLSHHGFFRKGKDLDIEKIFSADPKQICNDLLQCDAILYGKVFDWSRSYYAIQSQASVGVEIRMISARDGKELFYAKATDSDSRGLSKGPTSFSNIVIEPLKGLSNDVITELASNTVRKMLLPLSVTQRPEFLASSPPAILASAHDAPDGILHRNSPLNVVLLGYGATSAWFSIGDTIKNVPMIERDGGHYFGQYFPLPYDSFKDQPITVSLADKYGRISTQQIGKTKLSLASEGGRN